MWSPWLSTVLKTLTTALSAQCCHGSLLLWSLYPCLSLVSLDDLPSSLSILFLFKYTLLNLLLKKYTRNYKMHFFLQSFSFSSMGPPQDSPFYKLDWLSPTTSERKLVKDNLLITSPSLSSHSTPMQHLMQSTSLSWKYYLAWLHMPLFPTFLSPVCTCTMEGTLANPYSIICLFTIKFFKAQLMLPFSLYILRAALSCFTSSSTWWQHLHLHF